MSLSGFSFLIEEAGKNVRRNGLMSLAALTTVAISMAVLGGSLFALYRLHQWVAAQPRQFETAVFLNREVPREKALDVQKRIAAIPGVARVTMITREQAWKDLQASDQESHTNITGALAGENPLPDSFQVRASEPAQSARIADALGDPNQFPEVHRVQDDRKTLDKMLTISGIVRNVGGAAAILLFLATAFVIQNTIRLTVFARRREIRIMQLVGATPGFIRFPLVLEGVFYGVAGAAVASGVVLLAVNQVSSYTQRFETPLSLASGESVGPWMVVGLLVALGGLVGWLASVLSIRRFLKRI